MKTGYVKVLAAQRCRVGRCHGSASRFYQGPRVPDWRLWLKCGHKTSRTAVKPPMSVKCEWCEFDERIHRKSSRDWNKGDIPWGEWGVVRPEEYRKERAGR